MSFNLLTREGGKRYYVYVDGVRQSGYYLDDETAVEACLNAVAKHPNAEVYYVLEKMVVMNIAAIRSFAKSLSGVDNTNEGGPPPFPDVTITTTTLPNATVGTPYSQQLAATGGDGGYVWARITGTWPTGISMSSSGLVSGTPTTQGTANVTVRADDELGNPNSTDDQALTITVNAASGTPDWSEDWDYADTTAMKAAIENSSNNEPAAGDISLITGLTGTPTGFTKAMRATFLAAGSGIDHQIGGTLNMSSWASSAQPQEMWVEFYCRPSANWTTDGPYTGGGDPGHKFVLIFDQDETTAGRWDIVEGLFGGYVTGMNMGGASNPADRVRAAVGGDTAANFWDGDWHRIRIHALMDASAGIFECMIDDTFSDIGTGIDTNRDGTKYFDKIALSRNINTGCNEDMTMDFGPVSVFVSDPGWTFA